MNYNDITTYTLKLVMLLCPFFLVLVEPNLAGSSL